MRSGIALCAAAVVLASASVAAAGGGSARWFFTPGANGASCELDFGRPGIPNQAWCVVGPPQVKENKAVGVGLSPAGKLHACRGVSCLGNAPEHTPTLAYGKSVSLGPFRCTSLKTGVRCVVARSGHGFLLGAHGYTRV